MPVTGLKLQLDGTFKAVIRILGQSYTLATRASFAPGSSGEPDFGGHIKLEYHQKANEEPINLGTPHDVITAVQDLLENTVPANDSLLTQWDTVKNQLDKVPILSQITSAVDTTSVAITDLVLDLNKSSSNGADASFTLGLLLTPAPANPVRFLNAQFVAVGANVTVSFSVNTTDLGFSWP